MRRAKYARKVAEPFNGYMRVRRYAMMLEDDDTPVPMATSTNILSAPGHDVALVAALEIGTDGKLSTILKGGDTRPARVLRGENYVKWGTIGGRLDKEGADAAAIAEAEVTEEVGATVVDGTLTPLGSAPTPTMPSESTEADHYFAALVRFDGNSKPKSDGLGLELPGLMRPVRLSPAELLAACDDGRIGEGGRARVAYTRAFDRLGYIPQLDRFIFDLPPELKERFETLGLGTVVDLRSKGSAGGPLPAPTDGGDEAKVNDVKLLDRVNTHLEESALLVNARVAHAIREDGALQTVGAPFRIEFLHLPYDRVKLVAYAMDASRGPLVLMEPVERLPFTVKALTLKDEVKCDEKPRLTRLDVLEARMHIGAEHRAPVIAGLAEHAAEAVMMTRGLGKVARRLGSGMDASPGQSDLRFHVFGAEVPLETVDERFVPLSDAINRCREGEGDAATEAALLRLAEDVGWVWTLRMTKAQAQERLSS